MKNTARAIFLLICFTITCFANCKINNCKKTDFLKPRKNNKEVRLKESTHKLKNFTLKDRISFTVIVKRITVISPKVPELRRSSDVSVLVKDNHGKIVYCQNNPARYHSGIGLDGQFYSAKLIKLSSNQKAI
jgi:hypothetical protein